MGDGGGEDCDCTGLVVNRFAIVDTFAKAAYHLVGFKLRGVDVVADFAAGIDAYQMVRELSVGAFWKILHLSRFLSLSKGFHPFTF